MVACMHAYLFPGAGSGPLTGTAVRRGYRRVAKDLGGHPHGLRHAFVRQCRRMGLSWRQIADIVGHADEQVTRDHYGEGTLDAASWDAVDRFSVDVLGEVIT